MRAIVLVMDSFGIGSAPDAKLFGDEGADTYGHIAKYRSAQQSDRKIPLNIPHLSALGLGEAYKLVHGHYPAGYQETDIIAAYGAMQEVSTGKDTPSGHWELAGLPVLSDWGYFRDKINSFPSELLDMVQKEANLPGFLGNCHASGSKIIETFGEEHIRSGKPIVYTSADSVFQIACHEETFGLQRLYDLCQIVFEKIRPWNIGRVIARPFTGKDMQDFRRTGNRRDFAVLPPAATILSKVSDAGGFVTAIGKISDIYAGQGVGRHIKATGLDALWDATLAATKEEQSSLIMTNFVDFDQDWGHRRDPEGYARGLEQFDARLPEMLALLEDDDVLIITADHGCDPTWTGTEHTREYVPVLVYGKTVKSQPLGIRKTFSDVAQSLAVWFDLPAFQTGKSFLQAANLPDKG